MLSLFWVPSLAQAEWGLVLLTDPSSDYGTQVSLASYASCVDGYDMEMLSTPAYNEPSAEIRIRHQQSVDGWNAPTGWYAHDFRGELPVGASKVFADIYIWSNPAFTGTDIPLKWYWYTGQPDPENWTFNLQLIDIPDDISYNGPMSWNLTPCRTKTAPQLLVNLPTYHTTDGMQGYRLRVTAVHAVPEPSGLAIALPVLAAAVLALRRRQ
jgi:hypothetical protein